MSRNIGFLFFKYLKFTMPVVYVLLGIVLIFFRDVLFSIDGNYRTGFGVALIAYGALRFYQTFFKTNEDE